MKFGIRFKYSWKGVEIQLIVEGYKKPPIPPKPETK